jgi:hypothetical protein
MKKMGKNPQFVEKQQEKGDKGCWKQRKPGKRGGGDKGTPLASRLLCLLCIPLPYLPNSTFVIS